MKKDLRTTFDLSDFLESASRLYENYEGELSEKLKGLASDLKSFEPILVSELKSVVEARKKQKINQWLIYVSGGSLILAIVLALLCKK